ncbi:enoyl-CoA hydratase/isomerase family protein [Pseudohalioglobus sediminis]|uniref:Enoyl-CoA hydratase/isomerase family protein n=1 Tax=Pseudohalioglobus sediminis TaxID=2606449 RepID=A0A5B0WP06_9GAMM|nr:enoyl-CoA hydratase/isomerase family protein [Pseudohalioglobus sediminis]KAA1188814.1 enoyl-CoA hydratase/isomerase family protein [Pseudohalioglobus sediminis]
MKQTAVMTGIDSRGVATVTLDRAEKHNAFDDAMIAELREVFDSLAQQDEVRVVVLASAGKSFSAGADLAWMKRMAEYDHSHNLADARLLAGMLKSLFELPQPTVARVQGAAFGGAVGLVSCCDMAVASERASFSLSEVKIGLIPATISPFVVRAMGERACRRYFTTGERFGAVRARELGLVSEVVDGEALDATVDQIVTSLLGNGPLAVRQAKQLVSDIAGREISDTLVEDTCERIAQIRVSPEGQEGLAAFLNKRPPAWLESAE